MLKKLLMLAGALALTLLAGRPATAQMLTLTFTSDPSGISMAGSGTATAFMAFGNVQAFGGTVPAGVTKSVNGTTNWTLSTPFDLLVTRPGMGKKGFTLTAQLRFLDSTNTWKVGAITVTRAAAATITTVGSFGLNTAYTLSLTIPFSAAAGTIFNIIDILVTSN
jgi:hypothetical protein